MTHDDHHTQGDGRFLDRRNLLRATTFGALAAATAPLLLSSRRVEAVTAPAVACPSIQAYWVNSGATDVLATSPAHWKNRGITDLLVSINRTNYRPYIDHVVSHLAPAGIRVHAWTGVFKDYNGNWVNPNNATWANKMVSLVHTLGTVPGLTGIHLDYIRYPGTAKGDTASITAFCRKARQAAPKAKLSAALMPETTADAYYYGQDPKAMAQYLNLLFPMIYRATYAGTTRQWIHDTAAWFEKKVGPGKIVSGVSTYRSDSNPTPIPSSELLGDINAALSAAPTGFALFRDGLSTFPGLQCTKSSSGSRLERTEGAAR